MKKIIWIKGKNGHKNMINTSCARFCEKELKLHNLIVLNWRKFFTMNEFQMCVWFLCVVLMMLLRTKRLYTNSCHSLSLSLSSYLLSVCREVYKTKRCYCSCCYFSCCCVYVLLLLLPFSSIDVDDDDTIHGCKYRHIGLFCVQAV